MAVEEEPARADSVAGRNIGEKMSSQKSTNQ